MEIIMTFIDKLKFKLLTSYKTCKLVFNLWPPYWGTGIRVVSISPDFKEVNLLLRLRFYNKNYINTQFGGSLFAMTDPFFTFMLLKQLGSGYMICDKSAVIDFITFGKRDVKACLKITDEQINLVKAKTESGEKYLPEFEVDIVDVETLEIITKLKRTLYVRKRRKKAGSNS